MAAQLLNFNFDEADSVQAAEECSSIYTAIQFLQQECELCAERYPMRKVREGILGHLYDLFVFRSENSESNSRKVVGKPFSFSVVYVSWK